MPLRNAVSGVLGLEASIDCEEDEIHVIVTAK